MVSPHPANSKGTGFGVFLWRFVTGQHLDGIVRTNATWFGYGTNPSHHLNWWSEKPLFHRAFIRLFLVAVPVGLIVAYHFAPSFRLNLVVIILLMWVPFLFHRVTMWLVSLVPKVHVVIAHERVIMDEVDAELDEIHEIGDIIDMNIPKETKNVSSRTRTNRSTEMRRPDDTLSGD